MKVIKWFLLTLLLIVAVLFGGAWFTTLPGEVLTPAGVVRNQAVYVPAKDGTRIAVDVWLPEDFGSGEKVPALIEGSRYWRATRVTTAGRLLNFLGHDAPGADPTGTAAFFNTNGYAYVTADVRGTGASFGVHESEYSLQEIADYSSIIDWIVEQRWSNGRVGALGVSYAGTTAELMTTIRHPALRAIAPLYSDFDSQYHVVTPGGVYQPAFIEVWSKVVMAMDRDDLCTVMGDGGPSLTGMACLREKLLIGGVKPVDEDTDLSLLEQAVAEHDSHDVAEMAKALEYRQTLAGGEDYGYFAEPYGLKAEIEASGVPMYVVSGWFDGATSEGALARFATFSNRQTVTIGPFSHGGEYDTDPFQAKDGELALSVEQQMAGIESFFAAYLKDEGQAPPHVLRYFIQGARQFVEVDTWPPPGMTSAEFFLHGEGRLERSKPASDSNSDVFQVLAETSTGGETRWMTQMTGGDVYYDRRNEMTSQLQRYETPAFDDDVEMTGAAVLNLWLQTEQSDGAVHVYLDDIAPDGTASYLTEGVLRLLHRKQTDNPPYPTFTVGRSFSEADATPMPAGEPQLVAVPLFATSALIKSGHRLRLSIAGADNTSFARYPSEGEMPRWQILRGSSHTSSITIPVRPFKPNSGQ